MLFKFNTIFPHLAHNRWVALELSVLLWTFISEMQFHFITKNYRCFNLSPYQVGVFLFRFGIVFSVSVSCFASVCDINFISDSISDGINLNLPQESVQLLLDL